MDNFEKRLKRDADAIEAEMSPELRARIEASLHGIEPIRPAGRKPPSPGFWWASSLTGLAAALTVIVVLNWNRPGPAPAEQVADTPEPAVTVPSATTPPLDIRTADFTSPLEEELIRLQSDIEKARESVREDLDFTF
jgi:hypothetical protein